jgi:hypothetical protein
MDLQIESMLPGPKDLAPRIWPQGSGPKDLAQENMIPETVPSKST